MLTTCTVHVVQTSCFLVELVQEVFLKQLQEGGGVCGGLGASEIGRKLLGVQEIVQCCHVRAVHVDLVGEA